jgi:hypothetical protein
MRSIWGGRRRGGEEEEEEEEEDGDATLTLLENWERVTRFIPC